MKRAIFVAFVCSACSALGDPGGTPEALPHGGTGVFRPLDPTETGIRVGPGRALVATGAIEAAMVAGNGDLLYTLAPRRADPPMTPADYPMNEVFPDAFEPRSIHRAAARDNPAFELGRQVLAASEAWEGSAVFDPWLLEVDGTEHLYYAADGGIGHAIGNGTVFRKTAGPVLGAEGNVVPRRPSVVRIGGRYVMYYDAAGSIAVAVSDDGERFERLGPVVIEGTDTTAAAEVSVGMPGVLVLERFGRTRIRLYFESRRADGSRTAFIAGSDGSDLTRFERHPISVVPGTDVRFPAPHLRDPRVTLLYLNTPFSTNGLQTRTLIVSVSPAATRFDDADAGR